MRRALALAVLCLLFPTTAAASTVSATAVAGRGEVFYDVTYSAAPGEVNDLTASSVPDGIMVTDSGADITAGEGCTAITPNSVACTQPDTSPVLFASLGDGEDHFTSQGPGFDVHGGPDRDVLDGGEAGGWLYGGTGDDVLQGGKHRTEFYGGDGSDTMVGTDDDDLFEGGAGADSIDGRGEYNGGEFGGDTVSYADHDAPVTVDLNAPGSPAGAEGEGDSFTDVETAIGGRGDDTLTATKQVSSSGLGSGLGGAGGDDLIRGGPGRDTLAGGGGDDSIRGGGGDDVLKGGPGRDTLIGGGGSNQLWSFDARKPERDSVRCGEGGSVYAGSAAAPVLDTVDESCGYVDLWGPVVGRVAYGYVGSPTRAVSSTVTCLRHCGATVGLLSHGKVIGSATREIRGAAGGSAKLTVPLTSAARDELRSAGVLKLGFTLDVSWGARLRHPQATGWHLLLHDPPTAR